MSHPDPQSNDGTDSGTQDPADRSEREMRGLDGPAHDRDLVPAASPIADASTGPAPRSSGRQGSSDARGIDLLDSESDRSADTDEILSKAQGQVNKWKGIVSHLSERANRFRVEAEFMRGEAQRMMIDSRRYRRRAIDGETRFEAVINTVNEGILILDEYGTIELANPAAEFLLGRPKHELAGAEFGSPSARSEPTEISVISADGGVRSLEMRNREIAWQDRHAQLITLHDVTAHREKVTSAEAEVSSRDDFLSMLSFEIREPMSAIANAAKWLRSQSIGPVSEAPLRVIEEHVGHVTRMLDDLYDICQLSNDRLTLKRSMIDVGEWIGESVATVSNMTELIRRKFRLNVSDRPMILSGDADRLHRVLVSLLLHAVEMTEPADRIVLEADAVSADRVPHRIQPSLVISGSQTSTDSWLRVAVIDQGIGMDESAIERIFRPFADCNSIPREVANGMGLALPLSRRLVELHGGVLIASSQGPERGSMLEMFLPGLEDRESDSGFTGTDAAASIQKPLKVLVVDKSEDVRLSIRLLLESEGHSVTEASDGPSGLQTFIECMPDIALIHLELDGLTGEEIARVMRPFAHREHCRLVAMSHREDASDVQAAIDAGFDDFLVKPIRQQDVEQALFGNDPDRIQRL